METMETSETSVPMETNVVTQGHPAWGAGNPSFKGRVCSHPVLMSVGASVAGTQSGAHHPPDGVCVARCTPVSCPFACGLTKSLPLRARQGVLSGGQVMGCPQMFLFPTMLVDYAPGNEREFCYVYHHLQLG
jgi:hypothetical protein